jgi:hypothetical protein
MPNQTHDERGRFASSDSGGGRYTTAARERAALRQLVDVRKLTPTRTSIRNINPPTLYPNTNPTARLERTDMPVSRVTATDTGAHTAGIHAATAGNTLAQLSAAGTNPAIPPPKIGGA